jgi:hypothetical protein
VSSNGEKERIVTLEPEAGRTLLPFKGRTIELELKVGEESVGKILVIIGDVLIGAEKKGPSSPEGKK